GNVEVDRAATGVVGVDDRLAQRAGGRGCVAADVCRGGDGEDVVERCRREPWAQRQRRAGRGQNSSERCFIPRAGLARAGGVYERRQFEFCELTPTKTERQSRA